MTLHCRSSAGTGDFCLKNRYKLGQQGSSLAVWFLSLYSGVCPYSYADLMKRFQWLGPQARLHGIKKNPSDGSRAEFWRQNRECGGTGKACRIRKFVRSKQERACRLLGCGHALGESHGRAMNRNAHKKGSRQSGTTVKVKNRTKE